MKSKTVFAYDPATGALVKEFASCYQAERECGAYRGAISEGFKNDRKTPIGGYFWDFARLKKHPLASEKFSPIGKSGLGKATLSAAGKSGIPVDSFLKENDVCTKVEKALSKLSPNRLYTVDDVTELTGLRKGFPQLRQTLNAYREHQGKGVVDGQLYFGHPDKISELKSLKTMT